MAIKFNEINEEEISKEEFKKQIPMWCELLKESPEDDRLRVIISSMYYFINEKEKALKILQNAPKGDNLELKELKAIIYMDLDYYDKALEIFNEVLDIDYDESILDLKIDCLSFLERFEEVIEVANDYLEYFGNNIDVLTNKKVALEELNRKSEAKEVENLILKIKPVNRFALYMPKDQIDEVIPKEAYERELEVCIKDFEENPKDYTTIISIATFLYNLDRTDEAIEYLDKMGDDADTTSKNAKASMLMKFGKFRKAIRLLNNSLKENNKNISTFILKSECLMELERYNEVLSCTNKGLEIDKTNKELWENKFLALIELDRLVEAKEIQDLIFDLEIAENKVEGSLKKAINRYYSKDYEECLDLCYDVLDIDKDNELAATLMMNSMYMLGKTGEIPKILERALNCSDSEKLTRD